MYFVASLYIQCWFLSEFFPLFIRLLYFVMEIEANEYTYIHYQWNQRLRTCTFNRSLLVIGDIHVQRHLAHPLTLALSFSLVTCPALIRNGNTLEQYLGLNILVKCFLAHLQRLCCNTKQLREIHLNFPVIYAMVSTKIVFID